MEEYLQFLALVLKLQHMYTGHWNHLEALLNIELWVSALQFPIQKTWVRLENCISNKFSGDADGLGTIL